MGCGRAAAQASHAANAFIYRYGRGTKSSKINSEIQSWQSQTTQGFGTAIVLACNEKEINELTQKAFRQGFFTGIVTDPDYVVSVSSELVRFMNNISKYSDAKLEPSPNDPNKYLFHRSEVTCAYIFGDKEKLSPLLSGLPLYS